MFDMELKKMEVDAMQAKESAIEDRKDKRTKMEGSQQSAMIDQRNNDLKRNLRIKRYLCSLWRLQLLMICIMNLQN